MRELANHSNPAAPSLPLQKEAATGPRLPASERLNECLRRPEKHLKSLTGPAGAATEPPPGLQWQEVDYGGATFLVGSYRSTGLLAKRQDPPPPQRDPQRAE